jgi:cytochrome P450
MSGPGAEAGEYTFSRKPNPELSHLPGNYGLPVFGNTFGLLNNAPELSKKMLQEYGPVFRSSALFQRSVGLVGPDAAEFVLLDTAQNFAAQPAWRPIIGGLFENGLLLRDFSDHRLHRRALQQAFKKPVRESYCATLNRFLGDGISGWPRERYFDLYPALKNLLLNNAIESFFGHDPDCDLDRLTRAFIDMLNATLTLLRVPLPGSKWRRGLRGRAVIEHYLDGQLAMRKARPGKDFLSSLCQAAAGDSGLSDADIVDHMIFLLFAAHDTTASTLSSSVKILCTHPQWQTRLREECRTIERDDLRMDDFDRLPQLDWFFREVLRMHPPVPAITRRLVREVEFKGFTLPANCAVFVPIRLMHYMSEYWPEPERFDPERFSPERAAERKHKFQWLPFGGGVHKCLGLHFAEMQTKIFLFQLLRNYSVSLQPDHTPRVRYVPLEIPQNGLPIKLE